MGQQLVTNSVDAFRRVFERAAPSTALGVWLVEDVWLAPPTYFKRWTGRDAVLRLLGHASSNLDDLTYEQVWATSRGAALVFQANVGDRQIRGVDVLVLNVQGLITGIEIMARPPSAVAALSERMGRALAADPYFR